jgi:predicted extracellular nuclease
MAAGDGKVALVRSVLALTGECPSGGDLVDLVGYGDANCSEGGLDAPRLGANVSAVRAQAGCVDTNVNGSDFGTASPPTPRNSVSPLNDCTPPAPVWPHDIQGSGSESPLAGQLVAVRGIVTAKRFNNGFFIQTPDAAVDADAMTSEGVFVFTSAAPSAVNVGDEVTVVGTVSEFSPAADPRQPPITEIVTPTVTVHAAGQTLPVPFALTAADLSPSGGPLQLEKYEGMRVSLGNLTVVAPTAGSVNEANATGSNNGVFYAVLAGTARPFREAGIDVLDPPPPCDENAVGGCAISVFDANPERLRVDSDGQVGVFPGAVVSTGATITISAGVLDYGFRAWTVLPDLNALAIVTPGMGPQAVPAPSDAEYQVASFNLQRFFDTSNDPAIGDPVLTATAYANRLAKAALIVREYLRAPEIIGVQEAENLIVLQDLAAQIDADAMSVGQPVPGYQAHLIEGNDIGGIDVGFLTRAGVTVHSVTQWRSDETYINPRDGTSELLNDRPSLVLDATIEGSADRLSAHVFVVVNHLRSLNGIDDPVDGVRVRAKRKAQGESVAQLLIQLQTENPGVPVISIGDYNAFEFNDGFVDLLGIIRGDQAPPEQVADWSAMGLDPDFTSAAPAGDYSYSFDGNAQTLDHILLSAAASGALSGFSHAHIDADFPEVFRSDPMRPERLSDHDPAVARFLFPLDTIAPVFGPVSTISEPATSFDGATIVYTLPAATDNLDAVVAVLCAPASGTFFPVGATTVSCTASDLAGNTATTSFVVTVTLSDEAGSMLGIGQISSTSRVTFTFFARQAPTGAERGWLTLAASHPRALPDTFVAVGFDEVIFLGTTVRFSGTGWWNGHAGHRFVAESSDNGEPGRGRDTLTVTVRNSQGIVVLQASGVLSAGNVDKLQ